MIDHITKITNERRKMVCHHVFYRSKQQHRFIKRTYGPNENLPVTAINYMLSDETECRTEYYETDKGTQKVEIFKQK